MYLERRSVDHPCRYMYPACILNLRDMYLSGYIQKVCISECIPYVSRMYLDFVSRCILLYLDEESRIHVS